MILVHEYWVQPNGKRGQKWRHRGLFQCVYCGTIKDMVFWYGQHRRACGCKTGAPIHRLRNHPLYNTWAGMKARCYSENSPAYYRYGGRGIRICSFWRSNFMRFYLWATAHGWEHGLTIERKNNNGHYSPRNCRFIPRARQARNRRPNKMNETKVLEARARYAQGERNVDLARAFNIRPTTMCKIVHNKIWKGVTA